MSKLKIFQKGMLVTIGRNTFRTPAEFNITGIDVNSVKSQLRRYGVSDYKIIDDETEITKVVKPEAKKPEPPKEIILKTEPQIIERIIEKQVDNKVEEKLDKIAKLLERLNEKEVKVEIPEIKIPEVKVPEIKIPEPKVEYVPPPIQPSKEKKKEATSGDPIIEELDDEDSFIPAIDTTNMKVSEQTFKTEKSDDISENVKLLKSMNKKKK